MTATQEFFAGNSAEERRAISYRRVRKIKPPFHFGGRWDCAYHYLWNNQRGKIQYQKLMNQIEKHFSDNCELSKKSYHTCPHCADGVDPDLARRKRVLQLLALIEHPTALPADSALRTARELLAWTAQDGSNHGFESLVAAQPRLAAVA